MSNRPLFKVVLATQEQGQRKYYECGVCWPSDKGYSPSIKGYTEKDVAEAREGYPRITMAEAATRSANKDGFLNVSTGKDIELQAVNKAEPTGLAAEL